MAAWVLPGLILFAGIYGVLLYNKLVRSAQLVSEAWSGIDVQLKRRHDLIPNLVEIVKGYGRHEQTTLEEIVKLRNLSQSTSDASEKSKIEASLGQNLKSLFAIVEAYPELKADTNYRKLHESLSECEDQLQYARRYYNGAVRNLNILVQSFPSNLIASRFGFKAGTFFEIQYATERSVPDVKF